MATREQLHPALEWEAWVTQCMSKDPNKLNPNEDGTLWANEEMARLRKVIMDQEKKE